MPRPGTPSENLSSADVTTEAAPVRGQPFGDRQPPGGQRPFVIHLVPWDLRRPSSDPSTPPSDCPTRAGLRRRVFGRDGPTLRGALGDRARLVELLRRLGRL